MIQMITRFLAIVGILGFSFCTLSCQTTVGSISVCDLDLPKPFSEAEMVQSLVELWRIKTWKHQDDTRDIWPTYAQIRDKVLIGVNKTIDLDHAPIDSLINAARDHMNRFWNEGGLQSKTSYENAYKARAILERAYDRAPASMDLIDLLADTIQASNPLFRYDLEKNTVIWNEEVWAHLFELRAKQFDLIQKECNADRGPQLEDLIRVVDFVTLASRKEKAAARDAIQWLRSTAKEGGWEYYLGTLDKLSGGVDQGRLVYEELYSAWVPPSVDDFLYQRRLPSFTGPESEARPIVNWPKEYSKISSLLSSDEQKNKMGSDKSEKESRLPAVKGDTLFTFTYEGSGSTCGESFGMVMICPAHKHGTPADSIGTLKKLVDERNKKGLTSSVWVCRSNLLRFAKLCSYIVPRIVINPFVYKCFHGPTDNDTVWANADHPRINHIREIRKTAQNSSLFACINVGGEPTFYKDRKASFEEIKWMVYSIFGANYQGIIWRGPRDNVAFKAQLDNLESRIAMYSDELTNSDPIKWVSAEDSQPYSALASDKVVFVILLNPKYCLETRAGAVGLPNPFSLQTGYLQLHPPDEIAIVSGATIDGKPIPIERNENGIRVPYVYSGAGEVLVFRTSSRRTLSAVVEAQSNDENFGAHKRKNASIPLCQRDNCRFCRIVLDHKDDPGILANLMRLRTLDEVGELILSVMDKLEPHSRNGTATNKYYGVDNAMRYYEFEIRASDILKSYVQVFTTRLPRPNVSDDEVKFLQDLYTSKVESWIGRIAERGQQIAQRSKDKRDKVVQLSTVLSCLHVADEAWNPQVIDDLRFRFTEEHDLKNLERFALHIYRPNMAYQFALYSAKRQSSEPAGIAEYLLEASRYLLESCDYYACLHCLTAGISAAEESVEQNAVVTMRFMRADVLSRIGH